MSTDVNLADASTEGLGVMAIQKHLPGVGMEIRTNRHKIAPELDLKTAGSENKFEDE